MSRGAQFAIIDYENQATLEATFKNIDVVISTVSSAAILSQLPLTTAAKAAGVKLFVPSEFGVPSNKPSGALLHKIQVREKLKELDLPYTVIYNGIWVDVAFLPLSHLCLLMVLP